MITQGDWIVTKASDSGHHAVQVEHDQFICELDPLPEAADNAALIAAAPKLLAACRDMVFLENTNMTKKQVRLRIDIAKAAIESAENIK